MSEWSEWSESVRAIGLVRTLYFGSVYRAQMRLAHRFGWHYAPERKMLDGSTLKTCRWCGLSQRKNAASPLDLVSDALAQGDAR